MTRPTLLAAAAAALTLAGMANTAVAGSRIERACQSAHSGAASSGLCGCIQRVADQTLTGSDQRIAAQFFDDPHRAQEIRQSDRNGDRAFWERYRYFGDVAGKVCD